MGIKQKVSLLLLMSVLGTGIHFPGTAQLISYQEKIFVHPDRNFYLSGEKIWYTVYCIETLSGTPSAVSQVAALELFDPEGQEMIRQKVKLVNGMGSGVLQIPAKCNSGSCLLRAYTSWQRNDGPGTYGYVPLMIIDPERPLHQKGLSGQIPMYETSGIPDRDRSSPAGNEYRMQFYPEGGTLVSGVENHVVFTVTDNRGNPVDFRGILRDSDAGVIEEVQTCFPGIGSFHWTPLTGKPAKIFPREDSLSIREDSFITGDRARGISLPDPIQSGCAIELVHEGSGKVRVNLSFGPETAREEPVVSVLLRNKAGNRLAKLLPAERVSVLEFSESELSSGTNQIIVYGTEENILASRTFLMGPDPRVEVRVTNLRDHYTPRDTISVGLHLLSPEGEPDSARFSVSVCRTGTYLCERPSNSIFRSLQPGRLDPELLAIHPPPAMKQVADLLWIAGSGPLGTHWMKNPEQIRFMPEMEGEIVTGTVINRSTGLPLPNRRLLLSFRDTAISLYTGLTDSSGRFFIALGFQPGAKDLVIRLLDPEPDAIIIVEGEFSSDPLPEIDPIHLTEKDEAIFQEMFIDQQMNHAYGINHDTIKGKAPSSGPLFGTYDQHIVMEDYIRLPVMEEVFRELGKSVMLLREGKGYRVLLIDRQSNRIIGEDPYYFLDGVPFTDPEVLLQLDPLQLKDIWFKCSRYFINDLIMDGIIELRSVNGDPPLPELAGSYARLRYLGLPVQKYQFRADPPALANNHIPLVMNTLCYIPGSDYRSGDTNTLQWIAPDSKGTYDIIIKVLDADGNTGDAAFSFRVE
ncbi:MAG: hypothetical protein ACWGNV_06130 [Bacteroidales bacterium]